MKRNHIKTIGTLMLTLFLMGCSKILDEQPRAIFTPDYFKTTNGVMGGLTSMYAHLRTIYGNMGIFNASLTGTDEATWGASGGPGSSFAVMDFSNNGNLSGSNGNDAGGIWFNTFPNINTANGVIENGTIAKIDSSLLAEARFFRAFDYFLLVQTFGGVPLDMGSGELKFNTSTVRTSKRNTVPEVYTKVIFPDLIKAVNDLPNATRLTGTVTKTVARLFLSKAYLTYGWWLENPNNIPTYPACDRTDPNGHDANWYYQSAYDIAVAGISNAGSNYALQPTFYDVNVGSNDRNKECMLYGDHTQTSQLYNNSSLTYASGDADNTSVWALTFSYPNIVSSKNYWGIKDGAGNVKDTTANSVARIALQGYGRPWVRMAPPIGVFTNTFADKTNDSRYDGTFQTVFRGNWPKNGVNYPKVYCTSDPNMPILPGEPILSFLDTDPAGTIDYSNSVCKSGIGAGLLPGRSDYVVAPSGISRIVYPNLWKIGTYRTDNGTGLGQPNAGNTRPFVCAKFSEFYFIAAEAAVKGATTQAGKTAYDLINVIRARAGKWRWNNNGNVAQVADNSAAMIAATPATIDINYILAERSREFYGEGYRWFDLVRTQKWNDVATTYTICGDKIGDHTPKVYTRTILPTHYLRPIPQSQLDNMDETAEEKAAYQNPGY